MTTILSNVGVAVVLLATLLLCFVPPFSMRLSEVLATSLGSVALGFGAGLVIAALVMEVWGCS